MLPDGWKLTTLGKVCEGDLQTGPFGSQLHAHEYQEAGVPVLMPKDIINCRADISNAAKISKQRADDLRKHRLLTGDLLFSRRGDVARFALIDERTEGSLCGTGCLKARPSKNHSPIFLSYILQKNTVKTWLEQNAVGQTMPNMNTAILTELPLISASSREEEDKIAQILSIWDKAIEKLEALIAAKQKRKKALMQQLLTGKKRFAGFDGEWKIYVFSDLGNTFNGLTGKDKNDFGSGKPYIPYMNIFKNNRIDTSYLELVNIDESDNQCKVKYGDIYFTTSSETPDEVGMSSVLLNKVDEVYLNSFCFGFRLENFDILHPEFARYLFRAEHIRKLISILAQGATRYNLSKTQLLKIKLQLPCIDEQQKIASVLSVADREIETHQKQLSALKKQKKGLMQQLLTGKKRVKIDEPKQRGAVGG